jgi:hypothetical protein
VLKLLIYGKIGYVKSSPNGEILPNLVTLLDGEAASAYVISYTRKLFMKLAHVIII